MSVFDALVGQRHAVQTLRRAVDGQAMTHAWLFTGPPGSIRYSSPLSRQARRTFGVGSRWRHVRPSSWETKIPDSDVATQRSESVGSAARSTSAIGATRGSKLLPPSRESRICACP